MNPQALLISLVALAASLPEKIEKDEKRARLFLAAVQNKAVEMSHDPSTTLATMEEFAKDLGDLGEEYEEDAERMGNPRKWSLGTLFGHGDPFKAGRDKVRAFAAKWSLDPVFVEAMG